jgi:hypothetical protein
LGSDGGGRLTEDSVDVAKVVGHRADKAGEDVRVAVRDKLPVEFDIVLAERDAERGHVERDMQDAEEDEAGG